MCISFWQSYVSTDFVASLRDAFWLYEYIYNVACLYTVIYSLRLPVFLLEELFFEMRIDPNVQPELSTPGQIAHEFRVLSIISFWQMSCAAGLPRETELHRRACAGSGMGKHMFLPQGGSIHCQSWTSNATFFFHLRLLRS